MDLTLRWISAAALGAELENDREKLARAIDATVSEWPPEAGEWDIDAVRYFHELFNDTSFEPGWAAAYVILDGRLVASGGFVGPPDGQGEVEIGFSVCRSERRKGVATALVARLCSVAANRGCVSVQARTSTQNAGALATLRSNAFAPAIPLTEVLAATPALPAYGTPILLRLRLQ